MAPYVRRTAWPANSDAIEAGKPRIGIVVANFNTRRLIAQLVFSLYRLHGCGEFEQIGYLTAFFPLAQELLGRPAPDVAADETTC